MKNLSTAVSNAHVCEEGEKFSEINAILFNFLVTFFHILSAPSSKVKIFLPLLSTLIYLLHLGSVVRKFFYINVYFTYKLTLEMGKNFLQYNFYYDMFTLLIIVLSDLSYQLCSICLSRQLNSRGR